jgi:hypothetical protein
MGSVERGELACVRRGDLRWRQSLRWGYSTLGGWEFFALGGGPVPVRVLCWEEVLGVGVLG